MTKHKPSSRGWVSGKYTPKHPEKYLGNPNDIVFRSSWEEQAFRFCDLNPHVLYWASEEIAIPYQKPCPRTGTVRNSIYIPDLFVVVVDSNNNIRRELIEIKPKKQTRRSRARKPQRRIQEDYTYFVNKLKWEAAERWCKERNIRFRILTEDEQFV